MLMGQGRKHELLLAIILSGASKPSALVRYLGSMRSEPDRYTLEVVAEGLGLSPQETAALDQAVPQANRMGSQLRQMGVKMVALGEPGYPPLLGEIPSPPVMLFSKGSFSRMDSRAVAIVGSRRSSLAGSRMAAELAKDLAGVGFTIVSGLARGIDTAAHRGALEGGGRTIAVLGSGIDTMYPPENVGLADSIAAAGAVVTEFVPGTEPLKHNFPRRNRIISGLALGTVVVEAGTGSGALITADYALDQNRSVFAVPGSPCYSQSKGTNGLIKQGAKLVESADDVIEELCPQIDFTARLERRTESAGELSDIEGDLITLLSDAPVHVDEISRSLNLGSSETLSVLLSLQTRGLVRALPGKFYVQERYL
jgi:DNA processing protein